MTEIDIVESQGNMNVFPGQRVKVWDHLYHTNRTGIVIKRYGLTEKHSITCPWKYPDLCDVRYDEIWIAHLKGEERFISKGHFTYGLLKI